MRIALLGAVIAASVGACGHEVSRTTVLRQVHLGSASTSGEVAEEVETRHGCGAGTYAAYILTFGLAYIFDEVLANKFGARCPTTETTYEHRVPWTLPVGSAEPARAVGLGAAACVFAAPEEGCVPTRDHPAPVPAGMPRDLFFYAVAPDASTVVAHHAPASPCLIIRAADLSELPIGACEHVRYLDPHTVFVDGGGSKPRLVDVDTGRELPGDAGIWLGGGVRGHEVPGPGPSSSSIELVGRDGGPVWSARAVRGVISSPGVLVLIESDGITTLALAVPPTRVPLALAVDHVIEARGDLALVAVEHPGSAITPVAVIRISTGAILARH